MKTSSPIWQRLCLTLLAMASTGRASTPQPDSAGALLIATDEPGIQVLEERVVITPLEPERCYEIVSNPGLPLGTLTPFAGVRAGVRRNLQSESEATWKTATIAGTRKCSNLASIRKRKPKPGEVFDLWPVRLNATLRYELSASEDKPNVVFGFPAMTREVGDFTSKPVGGSPQTTSILAPAIAAFRVKADGVPVASISMENVAVTSDRNPAKSQRVPMFVWSASLLKEKPLFLEIEFDFNQGRFSSEVFPKDTLCGKTLPADTQLVFHSQIFFFLTPVRNWAVGPPKRTHISVRLPKGWSIPLLRVDQNRQDKPLLPTCFDDGGFDILLENQYPSDDLGIAMPMELLRRESDGKRVMEKRVPLSKWIKRPADLFPKWRATFGEAKLTCRLKKWFLSNASPTIRPQIENVECQPECP